MREQAPLWAAGTQSHWFSLADGKEEALALSPPKGEEMPLYLTPSHPCLSLVGGLLPVLTPWHIQPHLFTSYRSTLGRRVCGRESNRQPQNPAAGGHQLKGSRESWVDRAGKTVKVLVTQSCPTLCDPMDCSPPSSSVRGILQARILEWVAIPFSRRSSWPKDWTWVPCIGRWILGAPLILLWYTHISTNCSLNTSGLLSNFSTEKQVATEKKTKSKRKLGKRCYLYLHFMWDRVLKTLRHQNEEEKLSAICVWQDLSSFLPNILTLTYAVSLCPLTLEVS